MSPGPRRSEHGLSLIELLAALVVLALILTLVSSGFRFGVATTRAISADRSADVLVIDRAIRNLVSAAEPGVYPEPAPFRGAETTLALTTHLPAGGVGPGQRADVVLLAADGKLVLHWRPHRHAGWFGSGPGWQDAILAGEVEGVLFAYAPRGAGAGWAAAWNADTLPGLVRVTILPGPGSRLHWSPLIVALRREPLDE